MFTTALILVLLTEHDKFAVRERAAQALPTLGVAALPALEWAHGQSLEMAYRAREAAMELKLGLDLDALAQKRITDLTQAELAKTVAGWPFIDSLPGIAPDQVWQFRLKSAEVGIHTGVNNAGDYPADRYGTKRWVEANLTPTNAIEIASMLAVGVLRTQNYQERGGFDFWPAEVTPEP